MQSKKMGRMLKYATLVLAVVVILNATGCNLGSMFMNFQYLTSFLGGSSGLGI
jgi:uncharacterized membrane protein